MAPAANPAQPDADTLTEKQRWFLEKLGHDFNVGRAMREVGMSQSEYDALFQTPTAARLFARAREQAAKRIQDEANPRGTPVSNPEVGTRDFVNNELLSVLDDLKAERISPGQASAAKALLETYAKVNGLITTDVNVNVRKTVTDMPTWQLEAVVSGKLPVIDVVPDKPPESPG